METKHRGTSSAPTPSALRTPTAAGDGSREVLFRDYRSGQPFLAIETRKTTEPPAPLFFKWIKQHLRIKSFFGTSENAVKTQVWIAVSVYVLVAIIRQRLTLDISLHEILQILSLTMFETTPLNQLLTLAPPSTIAFDFSNQLNLFES